MSKDLESVVKWISVIDLAKTWNDFQGGGWGWRKPEWNGEFEDTQKYRYDYEFSPNTPIEEIIEETKGNLAVDIPFTFDGAENAEIVSAFLYASKPHKSTTVGVRDQNMIEITVFLRFKNQ